jgi:integrase
VTAGTYVHSSRLIVDQACEAWLASKHSLKPSTLRGHRVSLGPLRDELGDVEVQKLSKAGLDGLVGRLRRGEVAGRGPWSPRSCNYLLYLTTAVLEDQVAQGNVVRNVARLVDQVAGDPKRFRTLTAEEMFAILDHQCRDRHLWALALDGLRRGEIAGLRWVNVDLKAKTVTVAENRVALGKEIVSGHPQVEGQRPHAADARRGGGAAAGCAQTTGRGAVGLRPGIRAGRVCRLR